MSRRTHIVSFDDARSQRAGMSPRASARMAAADRLARRQQTQQSRRRARDAQEAGIRRGNSQPFLGRSRRRASQAGTNYPPEWDVEDSFGFDDYGEYAFDADRGMADTNSAYDRLGAHEADPFDDETYNEEEEAAVPKESWVKRFQRRNRKRRAERESARAIEAAPKTEEDAPRAAFYEMKMGTKHRSMVRTQKSTSVKSVRAARLARGEQRTFKLPGVALRVVAGIVVCLVALTAFLYPAAKDYYVAVRDNDKAQVALQVARERNAILEQDVAALATPEGIEDRARSEYGWVKEGENAVTVMGARDTSNGIAHLEELPAVESVQAPNTWYSDVLDPIFGYEG